MPEMVNASQEHILVIDDDRDIREDLKSYLGDNGFRVSTAENAAAARRAIHTEEPDLILLDVMMPGEDGVSLCRSIVRLTTIPIVFISARTDEIDRIVGLEVGADDYVCKPFNPRELLARIRSVLRRTNGHDRQMTPEKTRYFEFDRWTLDTAKRTMTRDDGVVVSLSSGEFQLLTIFIARPQIVLSRERIVELSHAEGADVFDRSVDSQVSRFRKKIERDPKNPEIIQTVWGGGYVFAADVKKL
ncbi:response regulator [Hyphomonas sp.]|uniref:response regulator n=1 Tax=Hyphomonas sp. TaxID=87 RepID=UPI0025C0280B|nr:response regulator [Hyphomonas sp.]